MAGASLDGGGGGGAGTWDRLYVTGFPREITEMDIRGLFAPFGEITEVKLVLRPDGLFRGAATVAFATAAQGYAASQALASYVPQGHNRPIVIKPSRPGQLAPKLIRGSKLGVRSGGGLVRRSGVRRVRRRAADILGPADGGAGRATTAPPRYRTHKRRRRPLSARPGDLISTGPGVPAPRGRRGEPKLYHRLGEAAAEERARHSLLL